MTEAHSYTVGEPRRLTDNEVRLLMALLEASSEWSHLLPTLADAWVQDMNDGGMGSLRFVGEVGRHFGQTAVEASYHDADGTPVEVAIFLDQHDALYELDVWKVDSSRLIRPLTPGHFRQSRD
jgi:Iap family predicted aminopeptidase